LWGFIHLAIDEITMRLLQLPLLLQGHGVCGHQSLLPLMIIFDAAAAVVLMLLLLLLQIKVLRCAHVEAANAASVAFHAVLRYLLHS